MLIKIGNSFWNTEYMKRAIDAQFFTRKQTAQGAEQVPEMTLSIYMEGEPTPLALRGTEREQFLLQLQQQFESQVHFRYAMTEPLEYSSLQNAEPRATGDVIEHHGEDFEDEDDVKSDDTNSTDDDTKNFEPEEEDLDAHDDTATK